VGRPAALAGVLVLLLAAGPARATPELRQELAALAKDIKSLLDGRGQDAIGLGQFTGPPTFPTSAGPGINQILIEELKKVGVVVKDRAKLGLKGEYTVVEVPAEDDDRRKVLAVQLKAVLVDNLGKALTDFTFERKVKGEQTLVELVGPSVDLPPTSTPEERDRKLRESYTDPKVFRQGTVVRADRDSKFGVEVLVGGKPREATEDEGLAKVPIKRGEEYAVRLINDSDREVAVRLSIDGLSMFAFSELRQPAKLPDGKDNPRQGQPRYSVVFVGPHKSVVIRGWHRNNEKSQSFLVTEYAKTAAAQLKHPAKLGTITAEFAASWKEDELPPTDEPPKRKGISPGDGTGFGPPVVARFREVGRNIGVIRATVSVRYNK
jgi:hypothetical protein